MTEAARKTVREMANRELGASDPSDRVELAIKGTNFTNGATRAINCDIDGVLNLVMSDGTAITNFVVHKGYNPVSVLQIAAGADTVVVWGLF